jgi:hypothetical protein
MGVGPGGGKGKGDRETGTGPKRRIGHRPQTGIAPERYSFPEQSAILPEPSALAAGSVSGIRSRVPGLMAPGARRPESCGCLCLHPIAAVTTSSGSSSSTG